MSWNLPDDAADVGQGAKHEGRVAERWEPGNESLWPTRRVEQGGAVGVRDRRLNGKDQSRSEKGVTAREPRVPPRAPRNLPDLVDATATQ
jgi:hypothetical protein